VISGPEAFFSSRRPFFFMISRITAHVRVNQRVFFFLFSRPVFHRLFSLRPQQEVPFLFFVSFLSFLRRRTTSLFLRKWPQNRRPFLFFSLLEEPAVASSGSTTIRRWPFYERDFPPLPALRWFQERGAPPFFFSKAFLVPFFTALEATCWPCSWFFFSWFFPPLLSFFCVVLRPFFQRATRSRPPFLRMSNFSFNSCARGSAVTVFFFLFGVNFPDSFF